LQKVKELELLQLKYFLELAHSEHLTKTAMQQRVTPSSISTSISKLEREIGVQLFDRTGRNIRLNKYGTVYLKYVEDALNLIDEGQREVNRMQQANTQILAVAIWNPVVYAGPINKFRNLYPEVHFRHVYFDPIVSGSPTPPSNCDLIIAPVDSFSNSNWCSQIIAYDHIIVALPPSHPLASRESIDLKELQNERFVFSLDGTFSRHCKDLCRQAGFTPQIHLECDYTLRPQMVVNEGLVCLTTYTAKLSGMFTGIPTVRLNNPPSQRYQAIFWKQRYELPPVAVAFRDFMIHYYEKFNLL